MNSSINQITNLSNYLQITKHLLQEFNLIWEIASINWVQQQELSLFLTCEQLEKIDSNISLITISNYLLTVLTKNNTLDKYRIDLHKKLQVWFQTETKQIKQMHYKLLRLLYLLQLLEQNHFILKKEIYYKSLGKVEKRLNDLFESRIRLFDLFHKLECSIGNTPSLVKNCDSAINLMNKLATGFKEDLELTSELQEPFQQLLDLLSNFKTGEYQEYLSLKQSDRLEYVLRELRHRCKILSKPVATINIASSLTDIYKAKELKDFETENIIAGVRLEVKGRFRGRARSIKIGLQEGGIPNSTVERNIDSTTLGARNKYYGIFGIKVWISSIELDHLRYLKEIIKFPHLVGR